MKNIDRKDSRASSVIDGLVRVISVTRGCAQSLAARHNAALGPDDVPLNWRDVTVFDAEDRLRPAGDIVDELTAIGQASLTKTLKHLQ